MDTRARRNSINIIPFKFARERRKGKERKGKERKERATLNVQFRARAQAESTPAKSFLG